MNWPSTNVLIDIPGIGQIRIAQTGPTKSRAHSRSANQSPTAARHMWPTEESAGRTHCPPSQRRPNAWSRRW